MSSNFVAVLDHIISNNNLFNLHIPYFCYSQTALESIHFVSPENSFYSDDATPVARFKSLFGATIYEEINRLR